MGTCPEVWRDSPQAMGANGMQTFSCTMIDLEFAEVIREETSVLVRFGNGVRPPARIHLGPRARTLSDDEVLSLIGWLQRLESRQRKGEGSAEPETAENPS